MNLSIDNDFRVVQQALNRVQILHYAFESLTSSESCSWRPTLLEKLSRGSDTRIWYKIGVFYKTKHFIAQPNRLHSKDLLDRSEKSWGILQKTSQVVLISKCRNKVAAAL